MSLELQRCSDESRPDLKVWFDSLPVEAKNSLEFRFHDDIFFTLKLDNKLIGIMSVEELHNRYADFRRFIIPEYRSYGFAGVMLNYLILKAKENNFTRIIGTIKTSNEKGTKYLSEKGFKIMPLAKDDKIDSSTVMLKL